MATPLEACAAGSVAPPLEPHKRQRSTYFEWAQVSDCLHRGIYKDMGEDA